VQNFYTSQSLGGPQTPMSPLNDAPEILSSYVKLCNIVFDNSELGLGLQSVGVRVRVSVSVKSTDCFSKR